MDPNGLIYMGDDIPDEDAAPRFAVRIARGLVTHWRDVPLLTWELAVECRQAIADYTGEDGEIESVLLYADAQPAPSGAVSRGDKPT